MQTDNRCSDAQQNNQQRGKNKDRIQRQNQGIHQILKPVALKGTSQDGSQGCCEGFAEEILNHQPAQY